MEFRTVIYSSGLQIVKKGIVKKGIVKKGIVKKGIVKKM